MAAARPLVATLARVSLPIAYPVPGYAGLFSFWAIVALGRYLGDPSTILAGPTTGRVIPGNRRALGLKHGLKASQTPRVDIPLLFCFSPHLVPRYYQNGAESQEKRKTILLPLPATLPLVFSFSFPCCDGENSISHLPETVK